MSRDTSKLSPAMQKYAFDFMKACKDEKLDIVIICTDRNEADQEAAFASGHSKAHFGQSAHNSVLANGNPASEAFDIGVIRNGKYIGDDADGSYSAAGAIGKSLGLVWAGDWKSFKELAHFQNPNWVKS